MAHADTAKTAKRTKPASSVDVGTPTVTGEGSANAVHGTVWRAKSKLVACYDKAAAGVQGKATAMFAIAPTGKVEPGTTTLTGLSDATLERCVVGVLSKLVFAKPKDGKLEVELPLEFARLTPANAGILGTIGSSSLDEKDIYGGLLGNEVGEMNGGFGYGRSGYGPGGGGTGWGTIGTGRYGTIGHGSGRASAVPTVSIGQPTVTGDLDKAIIRRYLKRNIQKIQYCYEKELLVVPSLGGTVKLQFTISLEGKVTAASTDGGLKNTNVESCLASVVQMIEFPKPKGTAEVVVAYPLTFRSPDAPAKPTKK